MNKNNKTLIMGVIFIAVVIISVVGLTVAYFTASVEGNPEASSTVIETADLRLVYTDGAQTIEMLEALPGAYAEKTFTVENLGNVEVEYTIDLVNVTNSFVNDELVYSLSSDNGGATATNEPLRTNDGILKTGTIAPGIVQIYTLRVTFIETGSNQNHNQGAKFSGLVQINTGDKLSYSVITLAERMKVDNNILSDDGIDFNYSSNGISGCTGDAAVGWNCNEPNQNYITNGLYYTSREEDTENEETVYYYRGAVENNYVIFGDYCWRIVRTNEDGSVRVRFGGSPVGGSCPQTGEKVNVGTGVAFNTITSEAKYVGYTYDDGTGVQTDSNIKVAVESWYEENMWKNGQNTAVTDLIADTVYCNDRTENVQANGNIRYGPRERVYISHDPSFICEREEDRYTASEANGNGLLKYPIGLLTADEMMFAGGGYGATNNEYYLYTSETYWTMSPYHFLFTDLVASMYDVYSSGLINYNRITQVFAVVPVMSLKPEVKVSEGTGEFDNPYVILTE